MSKKTDRIDSIGMMEKIDPKNELEKLRNANKGSAITVWEDGSWRRWQTLDAEYAQKDENWLTTILLPEAIITPEMIERGARAAACDLAGFNAADKVGIDDEIIDWRAKNIAKAVLAAALQSEEQPK